MKISGSQRCWEFAFTIAVVGWLIYVLREFLFFGSLTMAHDNFNWDYPLFHHVAENLLRGEMPWWNPYSHGGEPFYPLLLQMRLLEPLTLLTICLGGVFVDDILILFNWNRFLQSLVMAYGVYLLLGQWAKYSVIRLSLIPILLFSSFMFSSFCQDGIFLLFLWTPYILFFFIRIFYQEKTEWLNWLVFAGLLGLGWQSYLFAGVWTMLLFFVLGTLFFKRSLFSKLRKTPQLSSKVLACASVILLMMAPNIVLLLEKGDFVYPVRMMPKGDINAMPRGMPVQEEGGPESRVEGINMPYSLVSHTGTFSNIWNFVHMLSPDGNNAIHDQKYSAHWGSPSEAYLYMGMLTWVLCVIGLFFGKDGLKNVWLFVFVSLFLLLLGPGGGVHRLLFEVFPPMRFIRHTHLFSLFFQLCVLYFYVLGANYVWDRFLPRKYA